MGPSQAEFTTDLHARIGRPGTRGLARPVPWVSSALYVAVLGGGLYYGVMGAEEHRPGHTLGFVGCLVLLLVLDGLERRRFGARTPTGPAAVLLAVRLAIFVAVSAFDGSGLSRALFLLVPFTAYFAFGRRISLLLSAGCLGMLVGFFTFSVPGWYARAEYISDLLMFFLGLVLATSTAAVAVGEQAGRVRLEHALRRLEESHTRLTAYAGRVAELSTAMERTRVARDIHDSLGHHLTAISIQLEKASAFRDRDGAVADQALTDARRSAKRALEEVRHAVRALREGTRPFSLSAELAELAGHLDGDRLTVSVDVTGQEDGHTVESLTALYRAAQEGLTNARKHGQADNVSISVTFGESYARLVLTDDGRGFLPAVSERGFGLIGIEERARLLGGGADVRSEPGSGTTITVTIPRVTRAVDPVPKAAR